MDLLCKGTQQPFDMTTKMGSGYGTPLNINPILLTRFLQQLPSELFGIIHMQLAG